MEEKIKKLEELMSDEYTAKTLFGSTIEETRANIAKAGVDFTNEEMADILRGIAQADIPENGELNEKALDTVVGGSYNSDCYNVGKAIGKVFGWAVKNAKKLLNLFG